MNKQEGLSLVELLVGITLGLIVVGVAGTLYVSTLKSNLDNVKQQRFEQSAQILASTIAAGIRRAGFSNSATSLPNVSGWATGTHYYSNGTCALFTYVDTTFSTPKQQFFGYKLDTTTGIMYSYQSDTLVSCLTTTTWQPMTDLNQIKLYQASPDDVFSSASPTRLVVIHLIAEATGLTTGTSPVRREVIIKIFIRNG